MSTYDNRASTGRRRGGWSPWVPILLTATVATVGVAAWLWSQQSSDETEEEDEEALNVHHLDYENGDYGDNPAYGATKESRRTDDDQVGETDPERMTTIPPVQMQDANDTSYLGTDPGTWGSRMSGALRRTPSPQQILGRASKTVAAGVAAAGTAVGTALAAIREEDKTAYQDHETWSAEAESKPDKAIAASQSKGNAVRPKRRSVAVVVTDDSKTDTTVEDGYHEHASILSHIPQQTDFSTIQLYVLLYTPAWKDAAADTLTGGAPPSLSSSYSNIGPDAAQTSGEERSPKASAAINPALSATYSQALTLVEKDSMVLPFTSPAGHVHILRHIEPDVIYLQDSLAGDDGSAIQQLQTWMRQDIVLVVGADGGSGGIADSESEAEQPVKQSKWWQREERVGRGRGVVVVDTMRVHDDWLRRVQGVE